jgi:hypothetical protein
LGLNGLRKGLLTTYICKTHWENLVSLTEHGCFASWKLNVEEHMRAENQPPCNSGLHYLPPPAVKLDVFILVSITSFILIPIFTLYIQSPQESQLHFTVRFIDHEIVVAGNSSTVLESTS